MGKYCILAENLIILLYDSFHRLWNSKVQIIICRACVCVIHCNHSYLWQLVISIQSHRSQYDFLKGKYSWHHLDDLQFKKRPAQSQIISSSGVVCGIVPFHSICQMGRCYMLFPKIWVLWRRSWAANYWARHMWEDKFCRCRPF